MNDAERIASNLAGPRVPARQEFKAELRTHLMLAPLPAAPVSRSVPNAARGLLVAVLASAGLAGYILMTRSADTPVAPPDAPAISEPNQPISQPPLERVAPRSQPTTVAPVPNHRPDELGATRPDRVTAATGIPAATQPVVAPPAAATGAPATVQSSNDADDPPAVGDESPTEQPTPEATPTNDLRTPPTVPATSTQESEPTPRITATP
jgi:hypothetical protein